MYIEFKPGEKHAGKNADTSDTHEAFADCGWLLEKDEVVIDVDELSKDQIRQLISRFGIKTQVVWTDRGAHLYYRKPAGYNRARNGNCALGFPIESKTSSNSPNGVTIKRNKTLRQIDNEGVREILPWYFNSGKQYGSMLGLGEGDGRNSALFAHKQKLDNHQDTEKICQFINEVLFDKPLDEDEFNTVVRTYSGGSGAENEYELAENIRNQYRCVRYQGSIWYWNGDEYITDPEDDDRIYKTVYAACPGRNTRYVEEVIKQVEKRSDKKDGCNFPIRFRNGILRNGNFIEFRGYSDFTPYYIKIDYDPDAPAVQRVDDYIDQLTDGDEEYKTLLAEVMGYPMITDPERISNVGKFFIFRGNGANGKSTLLKIMRRIYESRNCSALSIKQCADPRYQVSMLGKLANLGDDIEPEPINSAEMKIIKNICTADTVETRRLYQQSMHVTYTAKLFFTANSDIRSYEKGYSYQRRVMWMPMFNVVDKPDPAFISKLTTPDALAYWLRLIVEGYQRIYTNKHLSPCARVEEYNRQYHLENNHMAMFLSSIDINTVILGSTPGDVRKAYEEYNDDPDRKYSPKLLNEALKVMGIGLGTKKVGNTTRRMYMRQKETTQDLFGVSK